MLFLCSHGEGTSQLSAPLLVPHGANDELVPAQADILDPNASSAATEVTGAEEDPPPPQSPLEEREAAFAAAGRIVALASANARKGARESEGRRRRRRLRSLQSRLLQLQRRRRSFAAVAAESDKGAMILFYVLNVTMFVGIFLLSAGAAWYWKLLHSPTDEKNVLDLPTE